VTIPSGGLPVRANQTELAMSAFAVAVGGKADMRLCSPFGAGGSGASANRAYGPSAANFMLGLDSCFGVSGGWSTPQWDFPTAHYNALASP